MHPRPSPPNPRAFHRTPRPHLDKSPMDTVMSTAATAKPPLLPLLSATIPKPTPSPVTLDQTKQLHARALRTHSPAPQLNLLVSSYVKIGHPAAALRLYSHLRSSRSPPVIDAFTVPSLLKACSHLDAVSVGREIHGFALKSGMDPDIFVRNSLIQMYAECGWIDSSAQVFDGMPDRDVVSYSTLIRSYARAGSFNAALALVREMAGSGVRPSEVAFINMISLFADVRDLRTGWPVHAYLIKNMAAESPSVNAGTSLIDMYSKCGSFGSARAVFDRMEERSTATWSAMIAGCVRAREVESGMRLFRRMRREDVMPNEITILSLFIECGLGQDLGLGKWLHAYVLRNGFEMSLPLATALVDMYCKCGDVRSARAIFDGMRGRDVMTWTAMIAGYSEANFFDEAFELFWRMKDSKIKPNEVTVVNLLTLCAEAGALDRGRWVHGFIDKRGIGTDVILATALVDMYAKCGEVESAYRVFDEAVDRDVCMWNAMLNGLAMNGLGEEANELFSRMETEGRIRPNDITFIGILRACSHSGLVAEGKRLFHRMTRDFGLDLKVEHYGCMVDLLGRAGLLGEALEMVEGMPVAPNVVVWGSLLAACKVHKNPKIGDVAARELLKLEPRSTGYNVLISNLYASEKRWKDVAELRTTMKDNGIRKVPGMSSIELNGTVHDFVTGDLLHPETKKIYVMVEEMQRKLKQAGHQVDTSVVLLNVDDEEKENALNYHSEKLAMAFGLISTAPGTPLRVVKNLRVCDDCHAATKLLAKIYGRVITVRDRNRFHRFSEGSCSCKDYW